MRTSASATSMQGQTRKQSFPFQIKVSLHALAPEALTQMVTTLYYSRTSGDSPPRQVRGLTPRLHVVAAPRQARALAEAAADVTGGADVIG